MPRHKKAARLWLRPARLDATGKVVSRATWIILDDGKHHPTRCAAGESQQAEECLREYLAEKYQPRVAGRTLETIPVPDVLQVYVKWAYPLSHEKEKLVRRIARLSRYWQDYSLADVNGETCRGYVTFAGSTGGARRDLEDLRAAINHHAKEGLHRELVRVATPRKGGPRERYLERPEVARLLWTAWRYRETQTIHSGPMKGQKRQTAKYPLRHIARFILIGIYTGTRAGAIAAASWNRGPGRSYVDLEAGIYYRLPHGRAKTKKRQPSVRLPSHLLAHMRRWARLGGPDGHFVEYRGKPIERVKNGFKHAVQMAGLEDPEQVVPHTLRHTAATWLMQAGVDVWEASGYLGMSVTVLTNTYGHHHPSQHDRVLKAFKTPRNVGRNVGRATNETGSTIVM